MAAARNSKPIRVALYARVSTTAHGQDVGLQLDELRQVAEQRGWSAIEYVDEGVSGGKASRPALDRLMSDVRGGRVQVVAVWRFDRFARSTSHLLSALEEFRARGVEFVSLREQIDTSTPMGKAIFTIVACVAELEKEIIRERVVAGVRRAQGAGKHCGRPRAAVPVDAAVALLRDGRGLREVATMLGVDRNVLRDRLRETGAWPPVGKAEGRAP
jgi:DNA invertase Pin-like site-specific DNA recombinase